jgi:uncharacterized protein YprB with RNaseH-like and TPR domain
MLEHVPLDKILFLDIETVSKVESYDKLVEVEKEFWDKKAKFLLKEDQLPEDIYKQAAIYAEFGKIVCISVGYISHHEELRLKSFFGVDEKLLLEQFSEMLIKHYSGHGHLLCAHNGKEFDFPYICRRMLVNGIKLPPILNIAGKKPWEIQHLDTMELWKFGDYKHYTALNLLAHVFDIPTPKDDINGSQVGDVYWQDKDLDRIVTYCQKDVVTIAQLVMKYRGEELISDDKIVINK